MALSLILLIVFLHILTQFIGTATTHRTAATIEHSTPSGCFHVQTGFPCMVPADGVVERKAGGPERHHDVSVRQQCFIGTRAGTPTLFTQFP